MKRLWLCCVIMLMLATSACKETYWTFLNRGGGEVARVNEPVVPEPQPVKPEPQPAKPEPAPSPDPVTPKDIIYVLGIDGMD